MNFDIGPFTVSVNKSGFVAFGVQFGGYGQDGIFLKFAKRVLWVRVTACSLPWRVRLTRFGRY